MQNKRTHFWDSVSKGYDKQANKKYSKTYELTIEKTRKYLKETDTVLDFACGTGITTVELAKHVKEILAIDISEGMVSIAREKAKEKNITNVRFEAGDIMNDAIRENSFDVMLAFNVLYFIEDIDEALKRIGRLLKSGGLFISVTDCLGEKKSLLGLFQSILSRMGVIPYIKKYKMKDLENIIEKAGFSIIESDTLYKNPPNYFLVGQK